MKFAILGTGTVGKTIATRLIELGHEVRMGSRSANNEAVLSWVRSQSSRASGGTFQEAAAFGEIIFNCTLGVASLEALRLAGAKNLQGKILIDLANALDFSQGLPPSLAIQGTDSLGEQIQRAFPEAHVVKTLNTMSAEVMVHPELVSGDHDIFMCGNNAEAKQAVEKLLRSLGWKTITDLGDITAARGTEQLLPLWLRLWGTLGTANFNFHVAK